MNGEWLGAYTLTPHLHEGYRTRPKGERDRYTLNIYNPRPLSYRPTHEFDSYGHTSLYIHTSLWKF